MKKQVLSYIFLYFQQKTKKMAHILLIFLIQVLKIMNNFEHESN